MTYLYSFGSSCLVFVLLTERGTNLTTEFNGAVATFLTMAYILAVNPSILADSGGDCASAPDFGECVVELRRQFVVATALTSMLGESLIISFC